MAEEFILREVDGATTLAYSGELRADGPRWEGLASRALLSEPPYHPVPGAPVYQIRVDGMIVLAAEHGVCGPMLDLVTAVLTMGEALLSHWVSDPGAVLMS